MQLARSQLTLLLATLLVALLPALTAGAAQPVDGTPGPMHRAGLVVRHGDGAMTYAVVAFPEASISGIELLERSGIDFLSVPFGGLGEGICQIEREGCDVSACRRTVCQATRSSPYWQYLDQTPDLAWRSAPLGASGSRVDDGDVLAWAWSAGTPSLPALDLSGVAAKAGLDPDQLRSIGQSGGSVAAVRSGIVDADDPANTLALVGGAAALVALAGVGGGVLIVRRRRLLPG